MEKNVSKVCCCEYSVIKMCIHYLVSFICQV